MNALGKAAIGVVAVGVAGGLGYYVYERNTEQPAVIKGSFELLPAEAYLPRRGR